MFHLAITPFPIGLLGPFGLFPAVFAEILAFYLLQRRNSTRPGGPEPFPLILVCILLVNTAPLAVGYILLGLTHHPETLVRFSLGHFLISWALSVAIEYPICRKVRMIKEVPHLLMVVAISNVASLAVLALLVWRLGPSAVL
jgi:hypothetical protein